ncbi:MAG: GNAT family N-acetyltransferase [Candidatus Cyclonatronum sp.]|uniref:GNAT family N-acetyltransferase n=1 Tax=Cyclonatronum sp. TaxID=3024185 RepID=UPI0025BB6820|nr:GNAT family N-acetyltransferase [Cyclonatronum sp.]MCH8486062.1 GNAT family N-acetyltransferase [Cyclonatronum sp.]
MDQHQTIKSADGVFRLRAYQQADEPKVLALWEAAFGKAAEPEVWRWKFHQSPNGSPGLICETETGKAVAFYGGIRHQMNYRGDRIFAVHLVDNMSHPDYRQIISGRKGLFILTVQNYFKSFTGPGKASFLYGYPGLKHFRLGKMLAGYQALPGVSYLETGISELKTPGWFSRAEIAEATDNTDFDALWQQVEEHYPLAIVRGNAFVDWRYRRHSFKSYRLFTASRRGEVLAYVCYSLPGEGETAVLTDVVAAPDFRAFSRLLYSSAQQLSGLGVKQLQTWLPPHHFVTSYLERAGFRLKPEPLGITPTWKCFDDGLSQDFANRNLYFTMGDGDLY